MGSELIVCAVVMEALLKKKGLQIHPEACWPSRIDTGATLTLVPLICTHRLGLPIMSHTDGRRVGTAYQKGSLEIQGWIDLGGYIGLAAVCNDVRFIIVASCQSQIHHLGLDLYCSSPICELCIEDALYGTLAILDQCPQTQLYYCDLGVLMRRLGGLFVPIEKGLLPEVHFFRLPAVIESAISDRKRKLDSSMSFRVWKMHRRFKHVSWRVLSNMLRRGSIINCDVSSCEIDLVASHQDCMACALARWKQLNEEPSSGLCSL